MKTIRRTRITIREREVVIVSSAKAEEEDHTICPLCKSHIHSDPRAPANCLPEDTQDDKKSLNKRPDKGEK
jgi:hypothetical protein